MRHRTVFLRDYQVYELLQGRLGLLYMPVAKQPVETEPGWFRGPQVELTREARGDWPIGHHVIASPGKYTAWMNRYGAVAVNADNGDLLGLRPHEFTWLAPYRVDDLLWVKEPWAPIGDLRPSGYWTDPKWKDRIAFYKADNNRPMWSGTRWRSGIFLPDEGVRFWLKVTSVRCHRLQEISEGEAIVAGSQAPVGRLPRSCQQGCLSERTAYSRIWDAHRSHRKFPWKTNPFVWRYQVEQVPQPQEAVCQSAS